MGNNIIIYKLCDLVRGLVVGNAADVGGLLKKNTAHGYIRGW